ncbi:hypothetical protein MKS88_001650 [Plasmodium brasilianum]|uniref:Uncharacterized protein n=2 Tax=Plasmodium (Plasmodium) TaxID=418103 RepID=A0A1D3JJX1_PLAMA|nr:conserved Plasmodium protein, unknown function [Plasmodium malariae]KAI4839749.1 hypothetical protein MKS88_001650 [Plasmodium brasilianum]SBT86692.1 conserved Plasmodium protein, unknown function [Plasmodium malariae]
MNINRINKIILCSKVELKSIEKIDFYSGATNSVVKDFCAFFFPILKYNNFHIPYTFHHTTDDDEKIVLFPKNKDKHIINLSLYKYSQQIYDRIIFLDKKFSK